MAISTDPRCEIRALVMYGYPDGITAYGHECLTFFMGRRGKPVRSSAQCRWQVAMGWPRSFRAPWAPRCRSAEAGPQPTGGSVPVLTIC